MKSRTLIAGLLLVLLVMPSPPHAIAQEPVAQSVSDEAKKITPEEEQEARAAAQQFLQRLRATNNITTVVDELFVRDFDERLRNETERLPLMFVRQEVIAQATPGELRQLYDAGLNLFSEMLRYWLMLEEDSESEDGGTKEEWKFEDTFPPEVLEAFKSDPVISALIEQESATEERVNESGKLDTETGETKSRKRDERFIETITELRGVISTSEKATALLRKHLPSLSVQRELQQAIISDEDFEEIRSPYIETFEREFYGFPPQTRFVYVQVEVLHGLRFELYLVEIDGHLKLLTAYPYWED